KNAHDATVEYASLIKSLSNANFNIGKIFGSNSYLPFSGIIGSDSIINMGNSIMYSFGLLALASEALQDGDFGGYRQLVAQAKTGFNVVGSFKPALRGNNRLSNFGVDSYSSGKFFQDMSRITSKIGVRGTGQAGRSVSGSAKARSGGGGRTRQWAYQADLRMNQLAKESEQRQSQIDDLLSLASTLGISASILNPSRPSSVYVGGRGSGMSPLWLAPASIQQSYESRYAQQMIEFSQQMESVKRNILGSVSSIGITSIDSFRSTLYNPLTTNDIQAQLDFQRRLQSVMS
ncbi:MAG: hypothetical protein HZC29_02130, partial [Thaumarchaeota archaeon]|nr:hypothetical protein [Nitrososphaerota archaeon]